MRVACRQSRRRTQYFAITDPRAPPALIMAARIPMSLAEKCKLCWAPLTRFGRTAKVTVLTTASATTAANVAAGSLEFTAGDFMAWTSLYLVCRRLRAGPFLNSASHSECASHSERVIHPDADGSRLQEGGIN